MATTPHFAYVGPEDIKDRALGTHGGQPIRSLHDVERWMASRPTAEKVEPFTYVVDANGVLLLAPRRSEHVACVRGESVLAAGELALEPAESGWRVSEVSNQSTGYCPDLVSWEAVAATFDAVGLAHPDWFTTAFVFRRCLNCGNINIVREDHFWCALCDARLPGRWNISQF